MNISYLLLQEPQGSYYFLKDTCSYLRGYNPQEDGQLRKPKAQCDQKDVTCRCPSKRDVCCLGPPSAAALQNGIDRFPSEVAKLATYKHKSMYFHNSMPRMSEMTSFSYVYTQGFTCGASDRNIHPTV